MSTVKSSPADAAKAILNTPPVSTVKDLEPIKVVPPKSKLVPAATPSIGVTNVGEVLIAKVVPVPVCEAIEVALPTDVIGPVRLALVVTVSALPVRFPTKAVEEIEVAPVTTPASTTMVPSKTNCCPARGVMSKSVPAVELMVLRLRFKLSICNAVKVPKEVMLGCVA